MRPAKVLLLGVAFFALLVLPRRSSSAPKDTPPNPLSDKKQSQS